MRKGEYGEFVESGGFGFSSEEMGGEISGEAGGVRKDGEAFLDVANEFALRLIGYGLESGRSFLAGGQRRYLRLSGLLDKLSKLPVYIVP